jgi:hypothetical protein
MTEKGKRPADTPMTKMATKNREECQGERVGTLGTLPQKIEPPSAQGLDLIVFLGKVPKSANFSPLALFHLSWPSWQSSTWIGLSEADEGPLDG